MTLFGWIYLVLMIIGSLQVINEIGKARKPLTSADAATKLLVGWLIFWALYAWGINS